MDRGTWWATVHVVAKSQTQLSNNYIMLRLPWALAFPGSEAGAHSGQYRSEGDLSSLHLESHLPTSSHQDLPPPPRPCALSRVRGISRVSRISRVSLANALTGQSGKGLSAPCPYQGTLGSLRIPPIPPPSPGLLMGNLLSFEQSPPNTHKTYLPSAP